MALSKIPSAGFQDNVKFRNLCINGDMSVSQRTTSTSGISTTGNFVLDRFKLNVDSMGAWTVSQSTDVPTGQGFANSMKWDCTTADASPSADDNIQIQHRFEGQNLQYLKKGTSSAESTTLSFWVKSNKTGTYICELRDKDNSNRHINKSYTISSADTWEKKIITFAGDTTGTLTNDNSTSIDLSFWLGAGSTFTSGSLQTSWGSSTSANRAVGQVNLADSTSNEWYVTGVQLEAGTASDFEFLPFDVNLARCQRYYQKSYDIATSPATVTNNGALWTNIIRNSSNQNYWDVNCYQGMRSSPTVTTYSPSTGTSGKFENDTDATDRDSAVSNTSSFGFSIRPNSGSGNESGDVVAVHWEASAEL